MMYRPFNPEDELGQGDVIENVTFTYVPNLAEPVLHDAQGARVHRRAQEPITREDNLEVSGQAEKSRVIILSQDCDVLHRPYICVGRVRELAIVDQGYVDKNNDRTRAQHIQKNYQRAAVQAIWFYLQESPECAFPKSLASFIELHSIKRTEDNVRYLQANRILRLTAEAVFDLQFRFSYYFGRFATTDHYMLTEQEWELVRER